MNRKNGFTLVELMIVIAVVAIGVALSIPSFQGLIERKAVGGATEVAYSMLQQARSQAVKRSKPILVDFNVNGTDWSIGFTDIMTGCNAEVTTAAGANSCSVDYDNVGSSTIKFLKRISGADQKNITMSQATGFANVGGVAPSGCTTSNDAQACFDFIRGLARTGAYDFASTNYKLRLRVTQLGHVSICIPSGEENIVGYDDC